MSEFHICLICHAEYGEPRDAPGVSPEEVFREWVPNFTARLDRFENSTGIKVPVTWCCGAYHDRESLKSGKVLCADHFPDQWQVSLPETLSAANNDAWVDHAAQRTE